MERHRGDRFDDRPGDHFGDGSGRRVSSRWSSDSTTERQPRYLRGGHGGRGEDVFGGNSSSGGRFHPYRAPQDFPPLPPTSGFRDGDAGEFGPSPPVGGPRRGFYGRGSSPDTCLLSKHSWLWDGFESVMENLLFLTDSLLPFSGSMAIYVVPDSHYMLNLFCLCCNVDLELRWGILGNEDNILLDKEKLLCSCSHACNGRLLLGCCFVKYATSDEADRAIRALHNRYTLPGGTGPIQVRYADGDRNHPGAADDKLFVASLNKQATAKEIEDIFSPYGRVEDVYIMRDALNQNRGCGFVKFSNREMAAAALNALNGTFVMRGCDQPLVVRFADPKRPRSADQRNGPAFGGPGLSPRSDATLVIRPTANLDEPRNGSKTVDSWQSPSPDSFSPASQSNPYGCGATLQVKGGPIAMTSDPGIYGPTAVSNTGSVSSLSVPPSQQGFNPSMAAVPSFGAQQISPLQKPMINPRNFPLPLKLQSQQGPASRIHLFNFQEPPQHLGQLQLPQSGGLSSNQDIPSQQLPGLSGQTSSQPLHPQKASSIVLQAPFSLQAQAMPTTANLSQFPASNVTPQMLQQPIQQFPSQVPQMLLQQQAQALQSSFQSSQQAIFQLQQQLQQMQQQQQVSEASKLQFKTFIVQSAWGGSQSTSIPPSTAASVPASVITTTVSTLPVAVNASPTVSITCNWTEHTSPDGFKYYYNNVTQESKLLPAQVLPAQQVQPQMLRQQYQASGGVQPHMQVSSAA
ncbi:hypothetical protein ZIOFF_015901 [Zingiber officinale]|uniref:RRM domain-containing protein n=1 Tax=Zingiber officinale TaxID=94328 RepID=A0A8J5LFW9_ZINOF|nr:hypothetical protein ZIOFF_015901 [Zingiber officinale]